MTKVAIGKTKSLDTFITDGLFYLTDKNRSYERLFISS